MIRVICPSDNIPERLYSVKALFNTFLGCNLTDDDICFDPKCANYSILSGDRQVIVEDHFFNKYQEPLSYLDIENLPKELTYFHCEDEEVPIIYGVDKFEKSGNVSTIGLDVFASTFFMLTRWEESLLGREEKGDCDENVLWTVRNGIHKRPIVHEYEMLLRRLLSIEENVSERNYQVIMTHDVDGIITPSFYDIIKTGIREKIHGRPKNKVVNLSWKQKLKYKRVFPRTTSQFDIYTDICAEKNIPEWFFVKVCEPGEVESTYSCSDRHTAKMISYLKRNFSHSVRTGFHPSQSTFNNEKQWETECTRIKGLLNGNPSIGRNHHLLYNSETYRRWNSLLPEKDAFVSNCVFHKNVGFRSGAAVPYPIFDLGRRQQLGICEVPCQIMDSALRLHKYTSRGEVMNDINAIIDAVRVHRGTLLLTWHIYVRDAKMIKEYIDICDDTVKYASR